MSDDKMETSTDSATLQTLPPGLISQPLDAPRVALLREWLARMDEKPDWTAHEMYFVREPEFIETLTVVRFYLEYSKAETEAKNWANDVDASKDGLLRYINGLLAEIMPLTMDVHRAVIGLPFHQSKTPYALYPQAIARVAELIATPCAGMAEMYDSAEKKEGEDEDEEEGDKGLRTRYAIRFRRMPLLMPNPPCAEDFDDFEMKDFLYYYHCAIYLSVVAGLLVDAINVHARHYGAALEKIEPGRKITGYAKTTYESVMAVFGPFLCEGRVYYNEHGRDLMKASSELYVRVLREMKASLETDPYAVVRRLNQPETSAAEAPAPTATPTPTPAPVPQE